MLTDIIIYTKDRACQLDLLLRSIKDNFLNVNKIQILEDWSDDKFKAGYDKIKSLNYGLDIKYIQQNKKTFRDLLRLAVAQSETDFILPFCDDDVLIRYTDITDISNYVDDTVIGIHLRYSSDLTISYGNWGILPLPEFLPAGDYLKWDWTTYKTHSRWGYAYQAASLIYKTKFFKHMINNIEFDLPNSLEGAIMNKRYEWNKKTTVAFKHSPVVNISVNKIQKNVPNRGGRDINYPPKELNSIFLSGSIINTNGIYNMNNICEFVEILLDFIKDTR